MNRHQFRVVKTISQSRNLAANGLRRSGLLTIVSVLGVALPTLLLARPALAEHRHLYVDAGATQNGDGSRHRPFWRITNAVVRARELRQDDSDPEERIVIHVRPGTYVGSYDSSHLANNPRLELLPIIINVPDLNLEGGTELDEDEGGLPTGTYPLESETLLTTDLPLTRGQVLLLIATTDDGMAGNGVSATGFVIDAQAPLPAGVPGFQIYVDRVSDFSIRRNLLRQGSGFGTRLASGAFERNLSIANNPSPPPGGLGSTGMFITGGSVARPAAVTLRRNRSRQNGGGTSVDAVANLLQLDLGANTLRLEPLQMTYDRSDPKDQQNIPDKLTVLIEGNDLSDNTFFGLRCGFYPPFPYTTVDTTQPITGTLRVAVRNNRLHHNGQYGLVVDPFSSSRSNARQFTASFEGTVENNSLIGNGRNAFLISFTNYGASIGYNPRQDWKYMQESMFEVADFDGEMEGFDYDHPLNDPFDGSPVVGNVLLVNGEVQPNGIRITPLP